MVTPGGYGFLSREQVQAVDQAAVEKLGIPGVVLMENAGRHAAEALLDMLSAGGEIRGPDLTVAILCGPGNNGGDGYVMARHLHNCGVTVELFAVKDPAKLRGDAATNYKICRNMGLPVQVIDDAQAVGEAAKRWAHADAVVDALLGTGFSGQVRQPMAQVIARINSLEGRGPRVMAVDVPSGLDCQSGQPSEHTVRAELTVTFVAEKVGFQTAQARQHLGRVVTADIGVPPELVREIAGR